jgi:hypothetical protein
MKERKDNMAISKLNKNALAKLKRRLGIDDESAINLALNRGLYELGALGEESFWMLDEHYRRPSNSNKPLQE